MRLQQVDVLTPSERVGYHLTELRPVDLIAEELVRLDQLAVGVDAAGHGAVRI